MKAYELQGAGLSRLVLVERPSRRPGPREIVVRMRAAALNARDLQIVDGHYPLTRGFPLVPLSDGVGEVVGLGESVTRVRQGERVLGVFAQRWLDGPRDPRTWPSTLGADLDGVLQELVVLHEDGVVSVPEHLSDEEAATLPTAGVTAWQALITLGGIEAGQSVLVQGTGGVALFALQFACLRGARAIVTSKHAAKLERARTAGATGAVDRTQPDWVQRVRELTEGAGVDHVIDTSGDLESSLACLRIGGIISQIGYLASTRLSCDVFPFLLTNARLHGITVGPRSTFEDMNRAIAHHAVRPLVDSVVPFERAPEAFSRFTNEARFGKVVIRF